MALKTKLIFFRWPRRGRWRMARRDDVTMTTFRHGDDGKSETGRCIEELKA
jgi:hypothetical protein